MHTDGMQFLINLFLNNYKAFCRIYIDTEVVWYFVVVKDSLL